MRVGGLELDVGDVPFGREAPRGVEHLRGDIHSGDLLDMRRKREGGVPGTGRDVEHKPGGLRPGELDEPHETHAARVNCAGGVPVGTGAKLLLDEVGRVVHRLAIIASDQW